jgi:hypothetical protein
MLQSFAFEASFDAPNPIPSTAMMRVLGIPVGYTRSPMDQEPPGLEATARAVVAGTILGERLGLS